MVSSSEGNELLKQVRAGMDVHDANGENVGTVDFVHFGEPDAVTTESDRGAGEGGGDSKGFLEPDPDDSLFGLLDLGLGDEANERMQRFGYIRIDGKGLFSGHKFVASIDIASVNGNDVALSVTKDSL